MPDAAPDPRPTDASFDRGDTARVEAFSDCVFSISITLLVLQIDVPAEAPGDAALARALLAAWPSLLAFLTSFAVIGVMWLNHRRLFALVRRSDATLLALNLALLLGVAVLPFPTELFATYLGNPGERTATLVLGGTFLYVSLLYEVMWHRVAAGRRLVEPDVPDAVLRAHARQHRWTPLVYVAALGVGWAWPVAYLGVVFVLVTYFAVPARWALDAT